MNNWNDELLGSWFDLVSPLLVEENELKKKF